MKIKTLLILAIAVSFVSMPVPAYAKDMDKPCHKMMHPCPFMMLDTNHDGFITKKEVDAVIDNADADRNGKVSKKEWMSSMHKPCPHHNDGKKPCAHDKPEKRTHGLNP